MRLVAAPIRQCFAAFCLLALGTLVPGALKAATLPVAPVALFSNYSCADTSPHIGSTINLYSVMVQPNFQIAVTATASAVASVTLDITPLALTPSQILYITDGERAWQVTFFPGNPIVLQDWELIGGTGSPLDVGDYSNRQLNSYTVVGGTKVVGTGPGAPQMWAQVALVKEQLYDNGQGADFGGSGDGLWRGAYVVTDLDRKFQNALIYVDGQYNGVNANTTASTVGVNIDAQLPKIINYAFTTNKTNYNGVLYLNRNSQGTGTAYPTNGLETFTVTTNKNGCNVTAQIATAVPKTLPPIVVPANATNNTAFQTWKGDMGNGVYAADGTYSVSLSIVDSNGVAGATITSLVRVISLRLNIQNVVLTPNSLPTDPNFTDSLITRVQYKVVVDTEKPGDDLSSSLRVLNWAEAGVTPDLNNLIPVAGGFSYFTNLFNTVFVLGEMDFLRANGTVGIAMPSKDAYPLNDTDAERLWEFRGDSNLLSMANCYTPDGIGTTTDAFRVVAMPDGDSSNDWDSVKALSRLGSTLAPTGLEQTFIRNIRGATPTEGNYSLRLRAFITGLDYLGVGSPGTTADTRDFCAPVTDPPVFRSQKIHFAPSARPEGDTTGQGFGIYTEDTSATFVVSRTLPPTGDTSPPYLINSNPTQSSSVRGTSFDILHPLSVLLGEDQSRISSDNSITRLVLKDPTGNVILGTSSTDGGTPGNQMTVYFYPLQPLTASGTYTLVVNACSVNCMASTPLTFSVMDERPPSVLKIELTSLSQGLIELTPNTTIYQGPFSFISEIGVRLGMGSGSSNTVDWQDSNLTLYEYVSGVAQVYQDIVRISPLTSTAAAPSDTRIHYRLGTPINRAGQFEIRVKATSQSADGTTYVGPDSTFVQPKFITQIDPGVISINHQGTLLSGFIGVLPLTITAGTTNITPSTGTINIIAPDFYSLGSPSGYKALSGTVGGGSAWQMVAAGLGLVSSKIKMQYDAALEPRIVLHYDDLEIPAGVSETALAVYGYDGAWSRLNTGVTASQSGTTGNTFVIIPLNSTDSYYAYAIFYPDNTSIISGPTPTPVPFKSTRAFNPTHANALYRMARFFYADYNPKTVEARVFDTSGQLIKVLSVGNGINLADTQTDFVFGRTYHYFDWDGRNDSGTLVRNGLYLVRWQVSKMDGSTDTMTKPVALIK